MSVIMKNAYMGQPPAANTTLYTCPANTIARVLKCTATNDAAGATTIAFNKIPSGDAAGVTNLIMNTRALGDKATDLCPEVVGQVLDTGDIISAIAGDADQVTVSLDVVEIV